MHQRYADQVTFLSVYIREAHPSDGWVMRSNERFGIAFEQPKTMEKRIEVASTCCASLEFTMPLLVDKMDNHVERAYSAFPDRLYIIDKSGNVAYKGGRGPFGYQPRDLEQTLVMLLLDDKITKDQ